MGFEGRGMTSAGTAADEFVPVSSNESWPATLSLIPLPFLTLVLAAARWC